MSIIPHRMACTISTQAWRPEEHCLLSVLTAVVSGKPATRAAARYSVAPAPGERTLPTEMSSTRLGSILEREMRDLKVWARRSAAAVLFVVLVFGSGRGQERVNILEGTLLFETTFPTTSKRSSESTGDNDVIG